MASGTGKVIGVPKFTKTEMRFVKLESDISTLPKDRFGIRTETGETCLDQFDLVIVPGRAFTTGAFNRGHPANRCLYRGILYKPRHKYR